jgi:hypothetical protein
MENNNLLKQMTLEKWSKLMVDAYGMKGVYAVSYAFTACFRDIILKENGLCPHLYALCAPGSGKSKVMESLSALFYPEKRKFIASSGTDLGLRTFLEEFPNRFHFIDELDEQDLNSECLKMFMSAYDNESRGGSSKKPYIHIRACIGLSGQNLVRLKNNALVKRSILINIEKEKDFILPITTYIGHQKVRAKIEPGTPLFNFTRKTGHALVTKHFPEEKIFPHYLRHLRATHLSTVFGFDHDRLVHYFGWTNSQSADYYVKLKTTDLKY